MYITHIVPRVSETDGAGHINNTAVPVWFEAGRNEIFKLFTPDRSFANWKLVIVNMNVDYVRQIYYGQDVSIHTSIQRIGNTSFTVFEELYQHTQLCAKGTSVYVNFNFGKNSSEIIPDSIRAQLQEHLLTAIK